MMGQVMEMKYNTVWVGAGSMCVHLSMYVRSYV